MAIERRNGRDYYYTKQRVNGRVVSRYWGGGKLGETWIYAAAQHDQMERDKEKFERYLENEEMKEFRALEREIDQFCDEITAAKNALLKVNGYHRHKGQWRKKRE